MAGLLPNELPVTTTILDPDLFITQRDGDVIVQGISKTNLEASLDLVKSESVILNVGANGDFTTIKTAMDSISDNSSSKRYTILVTPGVYEELNPIVGKSYVSVVAIGGVGSARVNAVNSGNLFVGAQTFNLSGLTFGNVVSGYAVEMLVEGGTGVKHSAVVSCENGFHVNHSTGSLTIDGVTVVGNNTGNMFETSLGSMIVRDVDVPNGAIIGTIIKGNGGNIAVHGLSSFSSGVVTGVDLTDTDATLRAINLKNTTDGIVIDGVTSHVAISGVEIHDSSNDGLRVGTGFIETNALHIADSIGYNVNVTGAGTILGNIVTILDNAYIDPSATIIGTGISNKEDDAGMVVHGELSVGTPTRPAETVLGYGDSYTNGMMVYTFDGSTYTDVTSAAQSASGSAFNFPNPNINTAIYIASDLHNGDYITHAGIKAKVNTAMVRQDGKLVYEYWDGSSWIEFNFMVTDSGGKYLPHAKQLFEDAGSYQIRYDIKMTENWVKNDPITDGTDRFWARIRIASTITASPSLEQFKLHGAGRLEVNTDGYVETFGLARSFARFPWDAGLLEAAVNSPGNRDIYLSDQLDIGRVENSFNNGATDRIGFVYPLPETIDTSTSIVLAWNVRTDDNSAGDIMWTIRWANSVPNDDVFSSQATAPSVAPTEQSITILETAPASTNASLWYRVDLNISHMISRREDGFPDILWLTLQRSGGNAGDTHSGDVALVAIASNYLTWCNGGHY